MNEELRNKDNLIVSLLNQSSKQTGSKQPDYKHMRRTRYNFCWPQWHQWLWTTFNESKIHLSESGTIEFAKNICKFLLQQNWSSADHSGNTALGSEKRLTVSGASNSIPEHNIHHEVRQSNSFCNSGHKWYKWYNKMIFQEKFWKKTPWTT